MGQKPGFFAKSPVMTINLNRNPVSLGPPGSETGFLILFVICYLLFVIYPWLPCPLSVIYPLMRDDKGMGTAPLVPWSPAQGRSIRVQVFLFH